MGEEGSWRVGGKQEGTPDDLDGVALLHATSQHGCMGHLGRCMVGRTWVRHSMWLLA